MVTNSNKKKKYITTALIYFFLIILGIIMIYPLLWMISASFKENKDIFSSLSLIPTKWDFTSYIDGWQGVGGNTFGLFFTNTFVIAVPSTVFIVLSSTLVAYGFARFEFPLKKFFFSAMLACLMLPSSVIIVPRYLLFNELGWLNTYYPFWIPALLAGNSFFIFQMIQFFRGVPRDLDEAAKIDGCGSFSILTRILMPLCKPAMISVALFNFLWSWNAFMDPLIYINTVKKYPISLALRMTLDLGSAASWNNIMAMSILSLLPPVIVFFMAQDYFIEGISTSGLKG